MLIYSDDLTAGRVAELRHKLQTCAARRATGASGGECYMHEGVANRSLELYEAKRTYLASPSADAKVAYCELLDEIGYAYH